MLNCKRIVIAVSCCSMMMKGAYGFCNLVTRHQETVKAFGLGLKPTDNYLCTHKPKFELEPKPLSLGEVGRRSSQIPLFMSSDPNIPEDDSSGDEEGTSLAAEFFATLKGRGMDTTAALSKDDEDDEDDSDSEEDDEERDISISEVNAFTGVDQGKVGKLAGNVTFTNKELYSSLKERVLESPSAFTNLVSGSDDDDNDNDDEEGNEDTQQVYSPPSTTPDSGLTAGEVVTTVLSALNHNDEPSSNYGVEILFAYSSPASVLTSEKAPTVDEYSDFLSTSEYSVLLNHSQVIVDKADYSFDGKKSYFTVRLRKGDSGREYTSVSFILSTKGKEEEDCWLIDSILIRPEGIRRRGRR